MIAILNNVGNDALLSMTDHQVEQTQSVPDHDWFRIALLNYIWNEFLTNLIRDPCEGFKFLQGLTAYILYYVISRLCPPLNLYKVYANDQKYDDSSSNIL
jgi:hypothetical protein